MTKKTSLHKKNYCTKLALYVCKVYLEINFSLVLVFFLQFFA